MERNKYENNDVAGVVTGLAWTSVGGDILFIESILSKGKGNLSITGNLGKVMKESATIAMEYMKSNADSLGINPEVFSKYNVHIHVPEGATPKDGPSAGITMLTALASAFKNKPVKSHLAMTGEITLRGKVLPVGGIKEKILAAKRAGINHFEFGGGARFQSLYFYLREDAFEMMDKFRKIVGPDANLQTLARGVNTVMLDTGSKELIDLHAKMFKIQIRQYIHSICISKSNTMVISLSMYKVYSGN